MAAFAFRPVIGAASADVVGNPHARYVLTPAQGVVHQDLGGVAANTVVKLDSVTGDTWVLTPGGWKAIGTVGR